MKLDLAGDPSGETVLDLTGEELEALTHPYPVGSTRYHAGMFALSVFTVSALAVLAVGSAMTGTAWWALIPSAAVIALHLHLARTQRHRWKVARIQAGANLPPFPAAVMRDLRMERRAAEAWQKDQRREVRRIQARRFLRR